MRLRDITLAFAVALIIFAIAGFGFREILYRLGGANDLDVGGFTFTWSILGDAIPTVIGLTALVMFYLYLALVLILKRKTLDLPIFFLIAFILFASTFIPAYQFGFQQAVKINLEDTVRDWCYDNNKLCEDTCHYWKTIQIMKEIDENYTPNR